ncbi:FRG domain-containing protein [Vibrio alginolyticus]
MKIVEIETVGQYVEYIDSLDNKANLWFRGVASEEQKPLPGLVWRNKQYSESSLEHGFLVSYKSYFNDGSLTPWDIFALMQHHGLPTRLLDWSESALVALFFALDSEPDRVGDRAIWVLNPYQLNLKSFGVQSLYCPAVINNRVINSPTVGEFNLDAYLGPNLRPSGIVGIPEKPIAINATQHLKRVSTQKGCFTVHGYNAASIDSYFTEQDDFHMIRLKIKDNIHRLQMINTLSSLGVDEEFIYQDLDALCEKIKRKVGIYS